MLIEAQVFSLFEEEQESRPFTVRRPEVSLPVIPTSERIERPRTVRVAEIEASEVDIWPLVFDHWFSETAEEVARVA